MSERAHVFLLGFPPSALPFAGTALLSAVVLAASWESETVRSGAAFALGSPDRWLALAGLGSCLATQPSRSAQAACAAFAAGFGLGLGLPRSALWPWLTEPSVFSYHHLLGPAACLLAGLALLSGDRWRTRLLPLVALVVATALSLTAAINDPGVGSSAFVAGAVLTSAGLTLGTAALRRPLRRGWTSIGERIAGSWLLTIGLLLSAVRLVPAPAPRIELVPPVAGPVWAAPDVPGYAPPLARDFLPVSRTPGRTALPLGTN